MNSKKTKILILSSGLIVLALIAGLAFFLKHQKSEKNTGVVAIPDSIISVSGNKPEESLLLSISQPNIESPNMKLTSLDQYVAPADAEVSLSDAHSLVITDNSGVKLYKTSFLTTPTVADNFNNDSKEVSSDSVKPNQTYGIRVPRAPDGSIVTISDAKGNEVLRFVIKDVKVHDNQADYKTVTSDDLQ